MEAPVIDDDLWTLIEPLLPRPKPRAKSDPGRPRDWQEAGVWDRLHELLLAKLREAGQLDFSHAAVDSSSVRAVGAGEKLVRTPRIARDPVPSTTSS